MKFYKIVLVLASIIFIGVVVADSVIENFNQEKYVLADVIDVYNDNIIVGNGCKAIVAETTSERAYSIQLGLEKRMEYRPMIHDNIIDLIKAFNITLEKVVLESHDNNFYYSDAYFRGKNKLLKLDMKPSDAIALALRADAPIYINKELLESEGKNICLNQR